MSGYLLDTDVVSMLSPTHPETPERFVDWLERMDREDRVFLSAVTVHEIEKGIALLEHRGAVSKAGALRLWLSGLLAGYSEKILPLDLAASTLSGRLEAEALSSGHDPGMADAIIAGIAKAKGLRVVSRNTRHFLPFQIALSTPEDAAELAPDD